MSAVKEGSKSLKISLTSSLLLTDENGSLLLTPKANVSSLDQKRWSYEFIISKLFCIFSKSVPF